MSPAADAVPVPQRRIKITPYFQARFTAGSVDGFRIRLIASDAYLMPNKIFRYQAVPSLAVSGPSAVAMPGLVSDFNGVCSPADLAELPEDAPDADRVPYFFRLDYMDLVFRSRDIALAHLTRTMQEIDALKTALDLGDDMMAQPAVWFGTPPP